MVVTQPGKPWLEKFIFIQGVFGNLPATFGSQI